MFAFDEDVGLFCDGQLVGLACRESVETFGNVRL